MYIFLYIYSRNTRLRRDFSRPPWVKEEKKIEAPAAPHSLTNFRKVMRISNMGLVLKLDNGKVVYIADEQTDGQTHPVRY